MADFNINQFKDELTPLLIHLQEQANLFLEEVIKDNRILKQEVSNLRNLVIKYEALQKDLEECVTERKECQREVKLRFAEVKLTEEGLRERNSAIKDLIEERNSLIKDLINNKINELYSNFNKEIVKFNESIVSIKIDAAKQGAKYGVIVSIITFIMITLISLVVKWLENKMIQ